MNIPKSVKVGGMDYKVVKSKSFNGDNDCQFSGLAKHKETEIHLATSLNNEPYSTQKIEECFFHEVLHCVDVVYNCQKLDEDTVSRLSQGLYQVLKDNKIF